MKHSEDEGWTLKYGPALNPPKPLKYRMRGREPRCWQQVLRHNSVATTQVYLHPNRDDLAAALQQLDEGQP